MNLELNKKGCGHFTETCSDPNGLGQFVKRCIFYLVAIALWRNAEHESCNRRNIFSEWVK